MKAVSKDGRALQFASDRLRNDLEIVMEAVRDLEGQQREDLTRAGVSRYGSEQNAGGCSVKTEKDVIQQ